MSEYPDHDGRRRDDDQSLALRLGSDVRYWWSYQLGVLGKIMAILVPFVGFLSIVASASAGYGAIKADYGDLPARVSALELAVTGIPDRVANLEAQVDSIQAENRRDDADRAALRNVIDRVDQKTDRLVCLMEVEVGAKLYTECVE